MKKELQDDPALLRIGARIKGMPDLEPPVNLLPSIMKAIRPKKLSWWRRAVHWAKTPQAITLTPLQAIPAMALILAVLLLPSLSFFSGFMSQGNQSECKPVPIVLSLCMPGAHKVAVIGSFNEWSAQGYEMKMDPELKTWTVDLKLPAGRYEYAFVVDEGKILADPGAVIHTDDGFGNLNSVLIVGNNETAI
jgi:hypothetical protein